MEEFQISRRKGLKALGATAGAALLGTGLSSVANAAPRVPQAAPGRPAEGTRYYVKINNNSKIDDQNALLFQAKPELPSDVYALAWFTKKCHMNTYAKFDFTIDYSFVWGQVGNLGPGRNYSAGSKPVPAQLGDIITLNYDGAYQFMDQTPGGPMGSLIVAEDSSVPGSGDKDQGNVGIGMSNSGLFVVETQHNAKVEFLPDPKYWIGFGSHVDGDVVTTDELIAPIEIDFEGYTHIECTYDGSNWTFVRSND